MALLVTPEDELIAVGRLLLAPREMGRLSRGVAVSVTAHAAQPFPDEPVPGGVEEEGTGPDPSARREL
jgi:hypothetical protein